MISTKSTTSALKRTLEEFWWDSSDCCWWWTGGHSKNKETSNNRLCNSKRKRAADFSGLVGIRAALLCGVFRDNPAECCVVSRLSLLLLSWTVDMAGYHGLTSARPQHAVQCSAVAWHAGPPDPHSSQVQLLPISTICPSVYLPTVQYFSDIRFLWPLTRQVRIYYCIVRENVRRISIYA